MRVKNWQRWQSYRSDRGQPPWIKIHRRIMRDPNWVKMTARQRGELVCIWLLAADKNGELPSSPEVVRQLCYLKHTPDLKYFQELGFIDGVTMTPERPTRSRVKNKEAETEAEVPVAIAPAPVNGVETWEAYSTAYAKRYGVPPVRDATVNSILCRLAKRLGEDAPPVAAFYVGHNNSFYVQRGHDVGCLLKDAPKLRTEWATGRKITATSARQQDRASNTGDIAKRLIEEIQNGKG